MGRGGGWFASRVFRGRDRVDSPVQAWGRHFSGLRGLARQSTSAVLSAEPKGREAEVWSDLSRCRGIGWSTESLFSDWWHGGRGAGQMVAGHLSVATLQEERGYSHCVHRARNHDSALLKLEDDVGACSARVAGPESGTWSRFLEEGKLSDAIEALELIASEGSHVSQNMLYPVIRRCVESRDLEVGRRVYALSSRSCNESNTFFCNQIIRMYAVHGKLEEAAQVFRDLVAPDVFSWSSIIAAHAERGQPAQAIELYKEMRTSGVKPDNHVYVAVLKACNRAADLTFGKEVHEDVVMGEGVTNLFVGSSLIDMYATCGNVEDARMVFDSLPSKNIVTWNAIVSAYARRGDLEEARQLFDRMPSRNSVSWTAMLSGYAQHGAGQEALTLYASMQKEGGVAGGRVMLLSLLKACASARELQQGKQLHTEIRERRLESDVVIGSSLVDMYAKCGSLEDARRIFDRLSRRDVVTWTAMIAGYVEQGLGQEALALYSSMQKEAMARADNVTFVLLLKACASVGALVQGKQLHSQIKNRGLEMDVNIGNSLVDMYAKCGRLLDACNTFSRLPAPDVVTWNALINGYAQHNDCQRALQCFREMQLRGVEPDEATFSCLLVACSHAGLVQEGEKCFKMMEHHCIVPTLQHYTCMVDLLARSGHLVDAENLVLSMPYESDAVTWVSLLSACKTYADAERGERCFEQLIKLEPGNGTGYVLMASIYAKASMWNGVHRVEKLRKSAGAFRKPAKAWIEVKSEVHTFTVGDDRQDISSKVKSVNLRLKEEGGHVPHTDLVLKPISEVEKEDALCGHAEKLALAFGLLNTPDGTPLLVTKNLRMCEDCHSGTKIMSKLEKRQIIVRDVHSVHQFVDGVCSCEHRW